MPRIFYFLFFLLLQTTLFADFLATLTQEERQWLQEQEAIKIGMMDHWAPLSFLDYSDEVRGISPEIVEEMNKLLGGKLKFVPKNWALLYEEAKQGEVHGVMDITPTKMREEFFYFSKPYLHIPHAIVSREDTERFLSLSDLEEKTVALEKSFVGNSYLQERYPKIKIRLYKNTTEALDALLRGEVEAYVGNRAVVRYKIKQELLDDLKIDAIDTTVKGSVLALGVSKKYPLFASIAQKALDAIPSKRYKAIFAAWSEEKLAQGGVAASFALTQEEKNWLYVHPDIKFSADSFHLPYEGFNKEQKFEGMVADYLALIEHKLGVTFEKVPAKDIHDVYKKAHAKEADFVLDHLRHGGLEATHLFSRALLVSPIVVVQKKEKEQEFINDISQLQGKKIAVSRRFVFRSSLQELYPELNIIVVDGSKELFEGLATGRYDTVLASLNFAGYYLHALGLHELKIVGRLDRQMELGFAVRGDWEIFVSILNKTIDSITHAEHQAIYKKWVNVTFEEPRDYVLIFSILGVMSFLPLGLFYWNFLLKKRVAEQTRQYQELNENLEHLVEIKTKEYQDAQKQAQEAARAKSDFLANMSHELRTPMNSIMGMTYLALQTPLDEKQKNYLQKIDNASKNLLGIINDILDFSKIEAGKMSLEKVPFELETILENISDLFLFKIQEKNLELLFHVDTNVPTALVGDPLRLTQVFVNLVGNAVKFTKEGVITVRVACVSCDSHNATIRFDVRDTGIGISKKDQERLFQPFSQADSSTTRRYGGTGLGLSISKHIVEMMGGEMALSSQEGLGSNFYFTVTFPLQNEQPTLLEEVKHLPRLRIMIVDDDLPFKEIFEKMIFSLQFEVESAASGAEAIVKLQRGVKNSTPFDLVFMDWVMPDMDGLETLQKIDADPTIRPRPKCIMITGHSQEDFLLKGDEVAVDGWLIKPITPSVLYKAILRAFGKETAIEQPKELHQISLQELAKSLCGASLLLVEDNAQNQEIAVEFLKRIAIDVDVANNGEEALVKLSQKSYDGVLMDCQMPVMEGYEATRKIRQDTAYADLPIIAMTANAMKGDREKCILYGMSDYISKPIDVIRLYKLLAKWIKPAHPKEAGMCAFAMQQNDLQTLTIEGLDLKEALARMAGNANLLLGQLKRFCESQKDFKLEITKDLESDDLVGAMRRAHTLKGLGAGLGAKNLSEHAASLERDIKSNAPREEIVVAVEALDKILQKSIKNIEEALNTHEASHPKADDAATELLGENKLLAACRELEKLLLDLDSDASEKAEILAPTFKALGYEQESEALLEYVHRFDYEEAFTLLQSLKVKLRN
jgi:signal transduction histidine kinase/CheY-like chemotaxis protein/membrane-bound lytic murein transglycosylase MltF